MKNKVCLLSAMLTVLCGSAWAKAPNETESRPVRATPAKAAVLAEAEKAERHKLVYKIVKDWGPYVRAIYGEDIGVWADRLVPTFRQVDTQKLRDAAVADTFSGVMNALTGQKTVSASMLPGGVAPMSLGDSAADLVFTPLPQCNLLDTRVVGGTFTGGVLRHFKASGANFTAQGGSNTNCGIPANPAALLLGVTAVNATTKGYFKLWPYGETQPQSSSMSYGPTQNTRNDVVVRMAQGLSFDFTAAANTSGAHLLVSVLGYYSAPQATALDCVDVSESMNIAANSTASTYAYCPAGYSATGGGCDTLPATARVVESYSEGEWGDAFCEVHNPDGVATTANARVTCCRVPGR